MKGSDRKQPVAMGVPARFRVTIYYHEPLYAQTRGIPLREHQGTFEVAASGEDEAVKLAVEEFKAAARKSSVGWHREITRIAATQKRD